VSSQLELHRFATGRESRVVTALTLLKQYLFKYQGHVSAALVLGGVDITGPHLHTVYPHGSTDSLPFVTMGSGSLAAMSVFEAGYKEEMTVSSSLLLLFFSLCFSSMPFPFIGGRGEGFGPCGHLSRYFQRFGIR
jgi:20S proteasome subunit beta 2